MVPVFKKNTKTQWFHICSKLKENIILPANDPKRNDPKRKALEVKGVKNNAVKKDGQVWSSLLLLFISIWLS